MTILDDLNPQSSIVLSNSIFEHKYIAVLSNLDTQTESFISTLCFNEGSLILTLNSKGEEEWIKIEKLTVGQLVKTYLHGYRKIKHIGKGSFKNDINEPFKCMYKLPKNENDVFEDLILTGGHSILVDEIKDEDEYTLNNKYFNGYIQKIDDKLLVLACASSQFIQVNDDNEYTYYHFVLENDGDINKRYGIWSNGVLTETPSEDCFLNNVIL
jgi:hypothetical protein